MIYDTPVIDSAPPTAKSICTLDFPLANRERGNEAFKSTSPIH